MSISEKTNVINKKIKQNKIQYDSERHTAKILATEDFIRKC